MIARRISGGMECGMGIRIYSAAIGKKKRSVCGRGNDFFGNVGMKRNNPMQKMASVAWMSKPSRHPKSANRMHHDAAWRIAAVFIGSE